MGRRARRGDHRPLAGGGGQGAQKRKVANAWLIGGLALLVVHMGRAQGTATQHREATRAFGTAARASPWPAARTEGPYALWRLEGQSLPLRTPAGWLLPGDWLRWPAEVRLDRWAARPGQSAQAYRMVADTGPLWVQRGSHQAGARSGGWTALRRQAAQRLMRLESEATAGLPRALLLGWDAVDSQTKEHFTRTGTRHLLALSGLHVGILWWLVLQPLVRWGTLWLPPRRRRIGRALLAWFGFLALAPFLGGGTPAVRACLAYALLAWARCLPPGGGAPAGSGRRGDALSLWAFALGLEQLLDPHALASLSLQLSYTATLGLILWARKPRSPVELDSRAIRDGLDPIPKLGAPLWVLLLQPLRTGWSASWVASLSTLPWIAWHFGEWSPIGPLVTLLLLPIVVLAIAAGVLWIVFAELLPVELARWPFVALVRMVRWSDAGPATPWLLPERPLWWLLAVSTGWLVFCTSRSTKWRARSARWALACSAWGLFPWSLPPPRAWIGVADVGHGTAVLMRFPCGRTVLYDGGSRDRRGVAQRVLRPWLRTEEPGDLHIALSHDHRDHAGALAWMAERVGIEVWIGAVPRAGLPPHAGPHLDVRTGRAWAPACPWNRCRVQLLRGAEGEGNEGSRNLLVECDGQRVLLCGDAEAQGLWPLIEPLRDSAPLLALLAPHHGSRQPHWQALLAATHPQELWFSASERSPLAERQRALSRNAPSEFPRVRWTAQDGGWIRAFTQPHPEPRENPVTLDRAGP